MTHASAISNRSQVMPAKPLPNLLHVIHSHTIGKYIAPRKGQNIAADERQNIGMPPHDYRRVLRDNLASLLDASGFSTNTLRATYIYGSKKGKLVSSRSVRYMLDDNPESPSPSLDTIAAVAARLGVQAHSLLNPGLDLVRPPVPKSKQSTRDLQEVARRVHRLMQLHGDLDALQADDGDTTTQGATRGPNHHRKVSARGPLATKRAPKT